MCYRSVQQRYEPQLCVRERDQGVGRAQTAHLPHQPTRH